MFRRWMCAIVCLPLICNLASAQAGNADAAQSRVIYTMAYVQHCIQVDELLRQTCARIGRHLPDKHRKNCDFPTETFSARTARPYIAFKEAFRAEIRQSEVKLAAIEKETRKAFEQQFAQVRAGKVSMFDLESLSRELGKRCSVIEREWLSPARKPR